MSSRSSIVRSPQTLTHVAALPRVELAGMHIVVNGKKLSLTRKAKAFRIIRAFFARPSPAMTTRELIQILDEEEGIPRRLSIRGKQAQHKRWSSFLWLCRRWRTACSCFRRVSPYRCRSASAQCTSSRTLRKQAKPEVWPRDLISGPHLFHFIER